MASALIAPPQLVLTRLTQQVCRRWPTRSLRMWMRNHARKWCVDRELVTRTKHGFRMRVSPHDYASYGIFFFGEYDERMSEVLSKWVQPGQVVLDIGAERGWFTLLMASIVGPTGHVGTFEAFPPNARKLRANVRLNDMSWIAVHEVAVSDAIETARFAPPSDAVTHHESFLEHCSGVGYLVDDQDADAIEVPTTTIDAHVAEAGYDRLDVIKMDIEGAEVRALRGAARTIERFRPRLAIEYNREALRRTGSTMDELDDLLESFGYDRSVYSRRGIHRLTLSDWDAKPDNEAVINVYAEPRS